MVQPVNIIDPVNSGTALYIYWKTTADATVLYGTEDFSQSQAGTVRGVHLSGLIAGARYRYKVVCGSDTSITGSFRTSPPSGTPFSYSIFGDTQLTGQGEGMHFKEIFQSFKPDLTVIEGDVGNESSGSYDSLFSRAPEFFANTILAPVSGNHDTPALYKAAFSMMPDSGCTYLFHYGSAVFCMIPDWGDYALRNTPLQDSLAASKAVFKIGVSHRPPYGPTGAPTTYDYLYGHFFEAAGGDLFYSGHIHGYWRTRWIKSPNHWDWRLPDGFPPDYVSNIEKEGLAVYCNGGSSWTPGSASDTLWSPYIVKANLVNSSYSIVTVDSVSPGVLSQKTYLYGTGLKILDSLSIDHRSTLPDPLNTLILTDVTTLLADSVLEQYLYTSVRAIANYANGVTDTTVRECVFASLDTFVAAVTPHGTIEARNIGIARIRVEKKGIADTAFLHVIPSTITLDSLRLIPRAVIPLFTGDTFHLSLAAYFHSGINMFSAFVDTFADWSSSNPNLAAAARGFVRGIDTGSSIKIIASWKGKNDTCLVSIRYRSLAQWCEVTASDSVVIPDVGSLNMTLTDDNLDSDTGNYAFMSGCKSSTAESVWVEVDLVNDMEMDQIVLFPRTDLPGEGFPVNFTVSVRTDEGATVEVIRAVDYPNPGNTPCRFNFGKLTGRFVRLTATKLAPPQSSEPACARLQLSELQVFNHPGSLNEDDGPAAVPFGLSVSPNPFNPVCQLSFSQPAAGDIVLTVHDISGRLVRTLVRNQASAGRHSVSWDARDDHGMPVSTGMYVCTIEACRRMLSKPVMLIR